MGILDTNDNEPKKGGGLLGDMDPTMRMMIGMSILNKFTGNNRGSQSGFGDVFNVMMQMQQLKRQQAADALNQARFGLDQQKFGLDQKQYEAQMRNLEQQYEAAKNKQNELNSMAQGVMNYSPPAPQVEPVVATYDQVPFSAPQQPQMGGPLESMAAGVIGNPFAGQNIQIPTEDYLSNLFAAQNKAAENKPKGAFVDDPMLREQAARLMRTGETANIKQAYDLLQNGGPFTLGEDQARFTGMGEKIASTQGPTSKSSFERGNKLRDEYVQQSKPFMEVSDAYARINTVRNIPYQSQTPINHVNALYNMMKVINPTIRLNEGTQATAEQTPGIPQQLLQQYNKAVKNKIVSKEDMEAIYKQADALYEESKKSYTNTQNNYRGLATRNSLNPEDVVIPLEVPGRYNQQSPQNNQPGSNSGQTQRNASQYSPEQLSAFAKDAIAKGADPAQVQKRIQQMQGM